MGERGRLLAAPVTRPLRRIVATAAARFVRQAVRIVGHDGTSLPGMVASRIDPTIVERLAADLGPTVLVVGTNGKTTTSRLLARVLAAADGRAPLANRSGANLQQGIASTLVLAADRSGRLPDRGRSAVFEVDELALDGLIGTVGPSVLVVLNLFRDQLDRFGEVDAVIERWRAALGRLPPDAVIVSCADDPRVEALVAGAGVRVVRFGLTGPRGAAGPAAPVLRTGSDDPTADPIACPVCGAALAFAWRSIGHLGDWACPEGHVRRTPPDIAVSTVASDDAGSSVLVFGDEPGGRRARIQLAGMAAAYDAAAAVATASVVGVAIGRAIDALDGATPAFGRFEEARYRRRRVVLALAKNPASLTESARVAASMRPDGILLGLSDEPADGRDVSWVWDVDFGVLRGIPAVGLTGTRLHDLGLRLKYALDGDEGPWPIAVRVSSAEVALQRMVRSIRPGGTLVVIATYTSLLAIRSALERRGAVAPIPR